MKKRKFKPLLFSTTVRNPYRFKRYLYILNNFKGQILTDDLAIKICGEAMRYGIYRPNHKTESIKKKWPSNSIGNFGYALLTDDEVAWLLNNNNQQHKEAGFEEGWASRFATIFMVVKQFGFAYFNQGEKIEISELGKMLVDNISVSLAAETITVKEGNAENDEKVFLHAMVKYHRDNPFVRVLNKNIPLVLLLKVIKLLNADKRNNNCGISRYELPLLIFWKDDDAQAVYQTIMEIREKYRYKPSPEVIRDYCIECIMGGEFKRFKLESITNEYPDEYIRKMRYTGLISLRGAGRFIDINHNEINKVDYILDNYSHYISYTDEKEYYSYVSTIDKKLLDIESAPVDANKSERLLLEWVTKYPWEKLKDELKILSSHSYSSDPVLKYLDTPVRFEFLAALAIKSRRPYYRIKPNYRCDDEGLPISTAAGNRGDIECYGNNNVLVEVTMLEGRQQVIMEGWSVKRHLEDFLEQYGNAGCMFVAPTIYRDTKDQFEWSFDKKNLYIVPFTIKEFISELDKVDKILMKMP